MPTELPNHIYTYMYMYATHIFYHISWSCYVTACMTYPSLLIHWILLLLADDVAVNILVLITIMHHFCLEHMAWSILPGFLIILSVNMSCYFRWNPLIIHFWWKIVGRLSYWSYMYYYYDIGHLCINYFYFCLKTNIGYTDKALNYQQPMKKDFTYPLRSYCMHINVHHWLTYWFCSAFNFKVRALELTWTFKNHFNAL